MQRISLMNLSAQPSSCINREKTISRLYIIIVRNIKTSVNLMHIILLTHERELDKKTNTGRLVEVIDGLHVTRIIWKRTEPDPALLAWIGQGGVGLLYPDPAELAGGPNPPLTDSFFSAPASLNHFILIDSTWQEARKIYNRSPYLQSLPRVLLESAPPSLFTLRRNQIEGGLCTAESVVTLLRLKHQNSLANQLETDFHAFVGHVPGRLNQESV
ncbi:DTW domain-containing protein [Neptunomonas antarctica]|uniref:tRNA-uridine aminocarboxypropyltransferase n=3 Tax=Neptunomonas antarctica TaxID=619304 RepID=A0A1N7LL83_9GAMM|nr:DTW domain-containing protein [Neptunomonas antarctica]